MLARAFLIAQEFDLAHRTERLPGKSNAGRALIPLAVSRRTRFPHRSGRPMELGHHVARFDGVSGAKDQQPLDKIFQLTHVSRPGVSHQLIKCPIAELNIAPDGANGETLSEMSSKKRNILSALAERRNVDRHDIQPVVQILPEQPATHKLGRVAVGGGDDAYIDGDEFALADTRNCAPVGSEAASPEVQSPSRRSRRGTRFLRRRPRSSRTVSDRPR